MLETKLHPTSAFVTLTYSDECLTMIDPSKYGADTSRPLATLVPKDLQNWLKRLRAAITPSLVRFYAVGEYGDENWRPHYHVALFNYAPCGQAQTQYRNGFIRCCSNCELVSRTWGLGRIDNARLEDGSAQYVAGYVTKKMTRRDDPRLYGREPEFSRMSNRPGIGAHALHEVASQWMRFNLDRTQADVPSALRHGKRQLPLGRYLTRKLRTLVGKEPNAPKETLEKISAEMRAVQFAAKDSRTSLKKAILDHNQGKRINALARAALRKRKPKL